MRRRQQTQPQVLRDIGVLILVHQDIAEPALVLRQNVAMRLEDRDDMQQKVAEIDRVQGFQTFLIRLVQLGAAIVERRCLSGRNLFRRPGAVLPVVDQSGQHSRRPALFVDVFRHDQLFQQPDLIVGVEDGEVRLQSRQFGMPPEDLDAERVESAEPWHPLDRLAQQPADPVLHFARGLVGEGNGQDLVRPCLAGMQQMRDPRGQRLGLAGSGARQHQNRAVQCLNRLTLRRVQFFQIRGPTRRHCPRRKGPGRAFEGI